MAYAVIGGTGQVGTSCIHELLARGERVRVQSRDPEKHLDQFPEAAWYRFDLVRDEPPAELWTDVQAMLLVRPPAIADVGRYIVPVLESARAADRGTGGERGGKLRGRPRYWSCGGTPSHR